ncbi:hypothetical protein ACROYT_G036678 [Oculina patagonica]
MKPLKVALCLAILIALSKNGYSEDCKLKTLPDLGKDKSEDFPSTLVEKFTPWQIIAEKYLTKRRTGEERISHVTRSRNPCVKELTSVVYNGNAIYWKAVCRTHSMMCTGPRFMRNKCGPVYKYITALGISVISDCECKA